MILWFVKLLSTVRKAIAGRRYPHQMAWAVAFGLLLGIVPHGNLLALLLLLVVLSMKINHAMAGLTAIGTTFVATQLDPYSHRVGDFVLGHPQITDKAVAAWQLPLMPWTDLNNTVVMGSFLIGVLALVPSFLVTYPIFRFLAPTDEEPLQEADDQAPPPPGDRPAAAATKSSPHQVVLIDREHCHVAAPHRSDRENDIEPVTANIGEEPVQFIEIPASSANASPPRQATARGASTRQTSSAPGKQAASTKASSAVRRAGSKTAAETQANDSTPTSRVAQTPIAVETRIDVIRMKDQRSVDTSPSCEDNGEAGNEQPMDEALNYLLRQLRDSQQRKAA